MGLAYGWHDLIESITDAYNQGHLGKPAKGMQVRLFDPDPKFIISYESKRADPHDDNGHKHGDSYLFGSVDSIRPVVKSIKHTFSNSPYFLFRFPLKFPIWRFQSLLKDLSIVHQFPPSPFFFIPFQ